MNYINGFDKTIIHAIHALPTGLRVFMLIITNAGSPGVCIAILLVLMVVAFKRKQKQLLMTESLILLVQPLSPLIKMLTKRVRPDTVYVERMIIKSYSFPSGHAYASIVVLGFLAYLAYKYMQRPWKLAVPTILTVIIFLIGVSRIYLGAHFPSDVAAGWLLGALVLFVVIKFGPLKSAKLATK